MIIASKCPYRISLLGGSSDLDWFVNEHGKGISIGFSINAYSTLFLKYRNSGNRGILNYSSREEYSDIETISHPIIRECFSKYKLSNPIELASFGDDISGAGLGSSSSFTVALINAINSLSKVQKSNYELAKAASEIEIENLKNPIGRQDQFLCSLGGINILNFRKNGNVEVLKEKNIIECIEKYSKDLYLVNTGIRRSSFKSLRKIKDEEKSYNHILEILKITEDFLSRSKEKSLFEINILLKESISKAWSIKRKMVGVMNEELFEIEEQLIKRNFNIIKLLGAGSGGYFLVSYNSQNQLQRKMDFEKICFQIKKVEIDHVGAVSWSI